LEHNVAQRKPRQGTAVGSDGVRPTDAQIRVGVIVVPQHFIRAHRNVAWHSFRVVFLGRDMGYKHLDQDNRLRLPLKDAMKSGETLKLTIQDGSLNISKDG